MSDTEQSIPFVPVFPRTIDQAMRMLSSADQTPDEKWKALQEAKAAGMWHQGDDLSIQVFCAHVYALTRG